MFIKLNKYLGRQFKDNNIDENFFLLLFLGIISVLSIIASLIIFLVVFVRWSMSIQELRFLIFLIFIIITSYFLATETKTKIKTENKE